MTDPRIEAAARAMFATTEGEHTWDSLQTHYRNVWLKMAHVALAAADAVVAGTSPETITIPEVRNDRPIPGKGGVDG
ncbi:hypothetical protein JK165_08670 [Acetobacter okinawensis]|uniref:hypothetical protein n=1 Tax=Acetobacter okinawensis TaxID=1076594 RepID=UPI001BABBD9A|nr:hypothetical protein [Acetobacter okinawensis]MBS0966157.1 hypothetical protein [Acetobacter okinawensis]